MNRQSPSSDTDRHSYSSALCNRFSTAFASDWNGKWTMMVHEWHDLQNQFWGKTRSVSLNLSSRCYTCNAAQEVLEELLNCHCQRHPELVGHGQPILQWVASSRGQIADLKGFFWRRKIFGANPLIAICPWVGMGPPIAS